MSHLRFVVRPRYRSPVVADLAWSLAGGGSVDEGDVVPFTLSCNKNGLVFTPGELVVSVAFQGQTTPLPSGTFSQTIGAMLAAVSVPGVTKGTEGTGLELLVDMGVWSGAPIVLSRQTVNRPEQQGNVTGGTLGISASRGTIAAGGVASPVGFTIVDTYVAPATNAWVYSGEVDAGGTPTLDVYMDAAVGTVVATISATGGTFASAEFLAGGDQGGVFSLVGNQLRIASVPTFQDVSTGKPFKYYFPGVRVNFASGDPIDRVARVRPRFAKIEPTGAGGATSEEASEVGSWRTTVANGVAGRKIVVPPSVTGVWGVGGNTSTFMRGSDRTYIGHPNLILMKDKCPNLDQGKNVFVFNKNFRVGAQTPGGTLDDRDAFQSRGTGQLVESLRMDHCTFAWSVDEDGSFIPAVKPWLKNIRLSNCLFIDPLWQAGHSEGNHALGPLFYRWALNVVFDRCLFVGCWQRNPLYSLVVGALTQNCVMIDYGTGGGYGGTGYQDPVDGLQGTDQHMTAIQRANLYCTTDALKARSTMIHRLGANANIYIPAADNDYANYRFSMSAGVQDFSTGALGPADVTLRNSSSADAVKTWPGFATDMDAELLPTATEQNRIDLFDHVVANAGSHKLDANGAIIPGIANMCRADADALTYLLDNGVHRRLGGPDATSFPSVESLYGPDWNGDGVSLPAAWADAA